MSEPGHICLVTSAHISYNPRLVKEADTLERVGFRVRVVAIQSERAKTALDKELLRTRSWSFAAVNVRRDCLAGWIHWFTGVLRQRFHALLFALSDMRWGVEHTYSRYTSPLTRLASRERADLFIAHNLQALPAAAIAAYTHHAKLGFDAEDFHRGQFQENTSLRSSERHLVTRLEELYIRRCDYRTAASEGIAEEYQRALRITKPVVILNVFPLAFRFGMTPQNELANERQGRGLSLYWYSQVIGADRGLEDALRATAILDGQVSLHLRGAWAKGYERDFWNTVSALGISDRVHILPPAPPEQLIERAAQHDVGLALETGVTLNRRVALTNKLFTYMIAGLAIVATDVPAQALVLTGEPKTGLLYPPGDAEALAANIRSLIDQPEKLKVMRSLSRHAAETHYCWEVESVKLVNLLRATLAGIRV